jgi:hypothetical protein
MITTTLYKSQSAIYEKKTTTMQLEFAQSNSNLKIEVKKKSTQSILHI